MKKSKIVHSANMPTHPDAIKLLQQASVLFSSSSLTLALALTLALTRTLTITLARIHLYILTLIHSHPLSTHSQNYFLKQSNVLFSPGKASNAGGVATSGLEM
jgi:glutamate dehydrogenase/leucine dehydrogenase